MLTFFFRKKRSGASSIAMLFASMEKQMPAHVNYSLPYDGASPVALIGNILFARKTRTDINHITGDAHYIAIGTGRNTVLTVHDVGSALTGNFLKRLYVKLFWFWIPALIVRRITVISEFTKNELSGLIPFAKDKIIVIHNSFNSLIKCVKHDFNKDFPTILHMGTKNNKNLERVLKALDGINCKLIVIGKLNDRQDSLLQESNIVYENYYDVNYDRIVQCYQECDIVSFPSMYEGFGIPILEANAGGRPVVAGDIPVLHEVAGSAACFVDPYSVDSIHDGFMKIITNPDYRNALVNDGLENVKRFSAESIAKKYNQIYMELKNEA